MSQKIAQILLDRPDDVTLMPSIAEMIRNTFNVDCCLIAVVNHSQTVMTQNIDWYLSTSSQMKATLGEKVNSLPTAANRQTLWDAMVAEPEKLLKTSNSSMFSNSESSCWLSQLSGSLMAISAPQTRPAIGG